MTLLDDAPTTDVLERTRAIVPELRARADQTARDRRVPAENVTLMRQAGSLKVIQARRNGGLGLGIRDHLAVVAELARGCASTAWVAGVTHAHSWLLSHFPAEAQDDAYADPDNVVSAVIGPRGRADVTADGFRLSGVWPFASGCESSRWLLLGAQVFDNGEKVDEGDFLVPTSSVTIMDDWNVVGLAGTGSCTVKVDDEHVPAHRYLSLPGLVMGKAPGTGLHGEWPVHCAPVPVLAIALTGSAIGIARQALADAPTLLAGKVIAYTADDLATHPVTHIQMADAAMHAHEGELILFHMADQIDAAARDGRELDFMTKARMRLDCAQGVRRCLEAVEILFHLSGASGIRTSSPLTRAVADLRAINQHGLLNLEMNQELYGRLLMGLEPNSPLI